MLGEIHEVDARSDVWSVGATAFALVSGRFVHEAETPEEMLVFTASRQALSLARVAPQAPRAFIQVVDRALRFDKNERWPSALAMQAAFAEACGSSRSAKEDFDHKAARGTFCRRSKLSKRTPASRSWRRLRPPLSASPPKNRPSLATTASCAESTTRHRSEALLGTLVMARAPAANDTTPAPWLGARWVRGAGASLVVAVAGAVGAIAALAPREFQSRPVAIATVLVQPPIAFPPFANRAAVLVAGADTSDARATARTPDAPAEAIVAPKALATATVEGAPGAAPLAPRVVATNPPSPAKKASAALEREPRPRDPSVGPSALDACSPPFTIIAVTGRRDGNANAYEDGRRARRPRRRAACCAPGPTTDRCIDLNEDSQDLRREGSLLEARALALVSRSVSRRAVPGPCETTASSGSAQWTTR